jgi:hypothetical protein
LKGIAEYAKQSPMVNLALGVSAFSRGVP